MEVRDNGYIYRYSSDLLTWKEHEKHAVQRGGHLASIQSEKEAKTVSSLVRKYGDKRNSHRNEPRSRSKLWSALDQRKDAGNAGAS